jgi:chemotaxis protein histidine kinase CheA
MPVDLMKTLSELGAQLKNLNELRDDISDLREKQAETDAAVSKQKKENEAAVSKQKKENEAALSKQKKENEAALSKQKKENEAALSKQKKENEAALSKMEKKQERQDAAVDKVEKEQERQDTAFGKMMKKQSASGAQLKNLHELRDDISDLQEKQTETDAAVGKLKKKQGKHDVASAASAATVDQLKKDQGKHEAATTAAFGKIKEKLNSCKKRRITRSEFASTQKRARKNARGGAITKREVRELQATNEKALNDRTDGTNLIENFRTMITAVEAHRESVEIRKFGEHILGRDVPTDRYAQGDNSLYDAPRHEAELAQQPDPIVQAIQDLQWGEPRDHDPVGLSDQGRDNVVVSDERLSDHHDPVGLGGQGCDLVVVSDDPHASDSGSESNSESGGNESSTSGSESSDDEQQGVTSHVKGTSTSKKGQTFKINGKKYTGFKKRGGPPPKCPHTHLTDDSVFVVFANTGRKGPKWGRWACSYHCHWRKGKKWIVGQTPAIGSFEEITVPQS